MPALPKYLYPFVTKLWKKAAHGQGMGRHTEEEAIEIGAKDLRAMSAFLGFYTSWFDYCMCFHAVFFLGSKPFFMGDEPTEVDCSLFAMLAMVVWTMPGDGYYQQLLNGDIA